MDPGDHKAVIQKLRSLPDVTHVLYLGRTSGSAADRDLAADLEGFRSLVAAARAAGCALQMTQFTSAEELTKGATQSCSMLASGVRSSTLQQQLRRIIQHGLRLAIMQMQPGRLAAYLCSTYNPLSGDKLSGSKATS